MHLFHPEPSFPDCHALKRDPRRRTDVLKFVVELCAFAAQIPEADHIFEVREEEHISSKQLTRMSRV